VRWGGGGVGRGIGHGPGWLYTTRMTLVAEWDAFAWTALGGGAVRRQVEGFRCGEKAAAEPVAKMALP
jgi:hypothetical protein